MTQTTNIITEDYQPVPGTHPETKWAWVEIDRRTVPASSARRSLTAAVDRAIELRSPDDVGKQVARHKAADWDGRSPIEITVTPWNRSGSATTVVVR